MNNPFDPSKDSSPSGKPIHPLERPLQPPQPPPDPSPPVVSARRVVIQQSRPILAYGFLGFNIIVFLADLMLNGQITSLGQKDNALIMAGELWRFVTPIFLHYGLLHLAINSYSLFIVGPQVERTYGHWRFAAIYLLSGISGVIASFAFIPYFSAGASGALFGLVGALLPLLYRNRKVFQNTQRQIMGLVQVIVINLLISIAPGLNIDASAHIGGLIAGLALGWFAAPLLRVLQDFDGSIQIKDESSGSLVWAAIFVAAACIGGLAYFVILLKQNGVIA